MNNYYINPDPYYTPKISIGPFSLKNIKSAPKQADLKVLKHLGENLVFTSSGKHAIRLALEHLSAKKTNVVGIVTTSGNSYVSKCVTETISEYCDWKMFDKSGKVDFLFVIHEFGALYSKESMDDLRILNIPIVNDFAYSFLSLFMSRRTDFASEINLTSLPKSFDINYGGIIHLPKSKIEYVDQELKKSILEIVSMEFNTDAIQENITSRKQNREFYKKVLSGYGYKIVWDEEEICPGVCMMTPLRSTNLQELKIFLQRNGIECSVFYGEDILFVPVHHFMTQRELEYVCFMIGAFKNDN